MQENTDAIFVINLKMVIQLNFGNKIPFTPSVNGQLFLVIRHTICLVLLHIPKCFLPLQVFLARLKIELHLVPLQTFTPNIFGPAQKLNLLNENDLLVRYRKLGTRTKCKSIFGLAQNIWTSPKYFGTCRRTRQNPLIMEIHFSQLQI